jgi:hypothetical protein
MLAQDRRRRDRNRAVASLHNALCVGSGHVAVITGTAEESLAIVEEGLDHVPAHAVLRLRAMLEEPLRDADRDLGIDPGTRASAYDRQRALESCIENAGESGLPIFAIVLDAETADAYGLERARMALECVPLAIGRVRMIVLGAEGLAATLTQPDASALASRIGTRVYIAPEKLEPIVMQAATFADRAAAYSLQRSLAEQVRDVHVARLHPSHGRLYSVRVVGLRTRGEIAHAESAIRRLGHDPVRIAADSRRRRHLRSRRERRPFWTRLFGR